MADNTEAMDRLKSAGSGLLKAAGQKAMSVAGDHVGDLTGRLEDIADGGPLKQAVAKGAEAKVQGDSPVMGAIKGVGSGIKNAVTGGGSGSKGGAGKATKSTNILETIDVGVPVKVAYNQWTEFGAFPSFMKKVENVESPDETKLTWKAQIFLSHRTWEASILEQVPDERIVWRSKGQKGHVDGAVTFHEIGPNLTRIMVVLEYYPQGLFEKTGNLWRAQGRRARADLRHFKRHVMTRTILDPDQVEGWRGVIEDGEVVKSHDEVVEEEQNQEQESQEDQPDDEYSDDEYSDDEDAEEGEPEDEYSEEEDAEEGEPEDEYSEEEDAEEGEPEDEYSEDEDAEEGEPEDEYSEEEDAEDPEEEPEDELEEEPDDELEEEPDDELDESEDGEDEERHRPRRRAS